MTKDEYVKTLEEYVAGKVVDAKHDDYYDGYFDGLKKAMELSKELDEPKKVVIPEFIANDIDVRKKEGSTLRDALEDGFDWGMESDVHDWFVFVDDGDENIRKYISAWDNGYEVEKEPELHVKLKGFEGTINYLNYDVNSKELFVDTTGLGSGIKIKFTKSWLKDNWSEYDAYNNAGLLEFEEVEDD